MLLALLNRTFFPADLFTLLSISEQTFSAPLFLNETLLCISIAFFILITFQHCLMSYALLADYPICVNPLGVYYNLIKTFVLTIVYLHNNKNTFTHMYTVHISS